MRILVTGATSGLGRNAVEHLLQAGFDVRATGRSPAIGAELEAAGASFVTLDLEQATAEEYAELVKGCDIVWHCAAKSSPWGSEREFFLANVQATERLAEAAGAAGVKRFIHISTPSIYFDFKAHRDIEETFCAETFANHYAKTKYQAEQCIAQSVLRYPATTYLILRPRGLFGPHDRVIIPRVLAQLARDRGVLRLPGGGTAFLDLTFVLNVVHAMVLASQNEGLVSGSVYNITDQQPARLVDMLHKLLAEQLGLKYRVASLPYPLLYTLAAGLEMIAKITGKEPVLTRYSIGAVYFDMTLSQKRAREELGYTPRYTQEQGIEITGAWFKQQGVGKYG